MSVLLSAPVCQLAYVTSDFDKALSIFGETYGLSSFLELRDYTMATGPDRTATLHIALAYAGPMQIEVMQPLSGDDGAWRRVLTQTGFQLVFHHEAHLLKTLGALNEVKAALALKNFPLLIEGEASGTAWYLYADQVSVLGHVVEYIYYDPDGFAQLEAGIPRY